MDMKWIFLTAFFFLIHGSLQARGDLVFCDTIIDSHPVNVFSVQMMEPAGISFWVYYTGQPGDLATATVTLRVAKLDHSAFKIIDDRTWLTDLTKDKLAIPYNIKSPGDYRFKLIDRNGQLLADEVLSVSERQHEADSDDLADGSAEADKDPEDISLVFYDKPVPDGGEANDEFIYSRTKGDLILSVEPEKEETFRATAEIWKKEGDAYSKFINATDGPWQVADGKASCKFRFPGTGIFKVLVYNRDNVLLVTGFVELE